MFLPAGAEWIKKANWLDDHSSLWKVTFSRFFRISNFVFPVLNPTSAYPANLCWLDSVCRKGHLEGDFLSLRNLWGKSDEWAEMLRLPSRTPVTFSVPGRAWKLPAFPAKCHRVDLFQRNKKRPRLLWALLSVIYPFVYIKLTIPTVKQEERFWISTFAVNSISLSDLQSCKKLFCLVFLSSILRTLQVMYHRWSDG